MSEELLASDIAGQLGPNERQVILSLSAEYRTAPGSQARQLTAHVARRHSALIERGWGRRGARDTYYRLTALGVAVAASIRARANQSTEPRGE